MACILVLVSVIDQVSSSSISWPQLARRSMYLAKRGSAIYPAANQLAYKEKWGLDLVQPEYIAFQGGISLGRVWSLLRVTNAV